MESHELLQEVFQKTSAKQIAAQLGLSLSMIYKWAEPDDGTGSGAANPLDRIEALVKCSNDTRIVHWICPPTTRSPATRPGTSATAGRN